RAGCACRSGSTSTGGRSTMREARHPAKTPARRPWPRRPEAPLQVAWKETLAVLRRFAGDALSKRAVPGMLVLCTMAGCAHRTDRIDRIDQRLLMPESAGRYDMAAHQAFVYP